MNPKAKACRLCLDWSEDTVAIIGSGYSLTMAQIRTVQQGRYRIVGVNDAYRLLDRLDILYAGDAKWWRYHWYKILDRDFDYMPMFFTASFLPDSLERADDTTKDYVCELEGHDGYGLSLDPNTLHYGHSSGFAALNLAVLTGAKTIVLLGFDYNLQPETQLRHWFGEHPKAIATPMPFDLCRKKFEESTDILNQLDVKVYRTSLDSALTMFPYLEV